MTIAQIVTTVTTIFYSLVFAVGYYLVVKGNRAALREMREGRLSGGRPQVLVEADYGRLPVIDLVVRNVSGGSAGDITFEFSTPIEDSSGFVVSDLPYLKEGIDFLGPGGHAACSWDELDPSWRRCEKRAQRGHRGDREVQGPCRQALPHAVDGKPAALRAGNRHVHREGLGDVVAALKGLSEVLSRAASAAGDDGRGAAEPGTHPR